MVSCLYLFFPSLWCCERSYRPHLKIRDPIRGDYSHNLRLHLKITRLTWQMQMMWHLGQMAVGPERSQWYCHTGIKLFWSQLTVTWAGKTAIHCYRLRRIEVFRDNKLTLFASILLSIFSPRNSPKRLINRVKA